jgi:ATP-dependent protease ClpP protease subunit
MIDLSDKRMKHRLWVLTISTLLSSPAYSLVTQDQGERCIFGNCWKITETITSADARTVAAIAQRMAMEKQRPHFYLDSSGGDVEAAISIGRLLRKMSAHAYVLGKNERCLSSCVFLYAGATHRVGFKVGIHRPFSLSTEPRTYNEIQAEQRRLNSIVKAFLEEMNVSPRLLEAMNTVPPERIRMLSDAELEEFGLGVMDPVLQELQDAERARELGLSMQELLRRKARADATCPRALEVTNDASKYLLCIDAILSGRM